MNRRNTNSGRIRSPAEIFKINALTLGLKYCRDYFAQPWLPRSFTKASCKCDRSTAENFIILKKRLKKTLKENTFLVQEDGEIIVCWMKFQKLLAIKNEST